VIKTLEKRNKVENDFVGRHLGTNMRAASTFNCHQNCVEGFLFLL